MGEPRRGRCPECPGTFALTRGGLLRYHLGTKYDGMWRQMCDGAGRAPAEVVADPVVAAEARGFRRAIEALRDEAQRDSDDPDTPPTRWAVLTAAADYLEHLATKETRDG